MRPTRFLLLLLALVFALAFALLRPLAGRAATTLPAKASTSTTHHHVRKLSAAKRRLVARRMHERIVFRHKLVRYAKHLIGIPYRYGGSSPRTGFDCSGFVRYVYGHFGISLPHSSYADINVGHSVSRAHLLPGDLVFFHGLGHVGIYVGHGRFIHAPHTGTRVSIASMYGWYAGRYDGARRVK